MNHKANLYAIVRRVCPDGLDEDLLRWAAASHGRDAREAAHALYLASQPPVGALCITLTRYPVTRRPARR